MTAMMMMVMMDKATFQDPGEGSIGKDRWFSPRLHRQEEKSAPASRRSGAPVEAVEFMLRLHLTLVRLHLPLGCSRILC